MTSSCTPLRRRWFFRRHFPTTLDPFVALLASFTTEGESGSYPRSILRAPISGLMAELFSVRVRYSAASLTYQISSVVGGSFAPLSQTRSMPSITARLDLALYGDCERARSLPCVAAIAKVHKADLARSSGLITPQA